MRWTRFLLGIGFSIWLLASSGSAQTLARADSVSPEPLLNADGLVTISSDVDEVNLVFSVRDRRGRLVPQLTHDDFILRDEKQPPERISYFQCLTDLPLRAALVVDTSGSVHPHFEFEKEAAATFLERILRPGTDAAMVMGFDTEVRRLQEFTDDRERLAAGIQSLRIGAHTALYDALYDASRLLAQRPRTHSRGLLILLSDGMDTSSRRTLEQALEMALRAEVAIYAVSTNHPHLKPLGDAVLSRLAEETGGRLLHMGRRKKNITQTFTRIEEELRSQYALGYTPQDLRADGRFRRIELKPRKRGLRAHVRRGYFAPKR